MARIPPQFKGTDAKRVKAVCARCGKLCAVRWPEGSDGSEGYPFFHRGAGGSACPGCDVLVPTLVGEKGSEMLARGGASPDVTPASSCPAVGQAAGETSAPGGAGELVNSGDTPGGDGDRGERRGDLVVRSDMVTSDTVTGDVLEPSRRVATRGGTGLALPAVIAAAGEDVGRRFLEFFGAEIANRNTRAAYVVAVRDFCGFCEERGLELAAVEPLHVAAYREVLVRTYSPRSVKTKLAAIRRCFAYLLVGGTIASNPAADVKGPKVSSREGSTPVLFEREARAFLHSIDTSHVVGLRDRAVVAVMLYTFARVAAVVGMRVRDYVRGEFPFVRIAEKGGKYRQIPAVPRLVEYLDPYLEVAELGEDPAAPLFQTTRGRERMLTGRSMSRSDVLRMIKRRSADGGFSAELTCHTFRGTGITEYLDKGGDIDIAAEIAGHASTDTTRVYDRRDLRGRFADELRRIQI